MKNFYKNNWIASIPRNDSKKQSVIFIMIKHRYRWYIFFSTMMCMQYTYSAPVHITPKQSHFLRRAKKNVLLSPLIKQNNAITRVTTCPGKTVIRAADMPYIITKPGYYIIAEDVVNYSNASPAIQVNVAVPPLQNGPVTIDLCSHCISINSITNAILMTTPADVRNGYLQANTRLSLINGTIGAVDNITFIGNSSATINNNDVGVSINGGSGNASIKKCIFLQYFYRNKYQFYCGIDY